MSRCRNQLEAVDRPEPSATASLLNVVGHDTVHAEEEGLARTADPLILSWCPA